MDAYTELILGQKRYEIEEMFRKPYIERRVPPIPLENELIKVIMGPRRSGKSFYAIHQIHALGDFAYVNFEDTRLTKFQSFEHLVQALQEVYGTTKRVLIDEIQNLANWEELALFFQRRGYNVFITGSNAKLLSSELATNLTGRFSVILIWPFTFREYLIAQKASSQLTSLELQQHLASYLRGGGFPTVIVGNVNHVSYLKDLYDSILLKDIRNRFGIRKPALLEDFGRYLMANNASELSYSNVAKKLKCATDTLIIYFAYLDEAFLFFAIPRYSPKMSDQVVYNKKVYCIDPGMVQVNGFRVLDNEDKLYETAVAIRLHQLEVAGKIKVFYWKSQENYEVDFVVKKDLEEFVLIQVSLLVEDPVTMLREIRALIRGSQEFDSDNLIVLTKSFESVESKTWQGVTKKIQFIPLYKWLVGDSFP